MINRYDAPEGMVAARATPDEENNSCAGCAKNNETFIQKNCPYLCRSDERDDGEDVIFKTRDEFEKMLLAEIEAFYNKGKVKRIIFTETDIKPEKV